MRLRVRAPGTLARQRNSRNSTIGFDLEAFARLLPALALAILLTGCAVPLGPGFRLRSRQMVLGGATAPQAPVHVRVSDQITNTGNRALPSLEVSLPTPIDPANSNLTILVDGKPVKPVPESDDPAAPFRIQFDPPWPARERREIVLEYDLSTDPVSGGVASATAEGFYLADPHALPFWLTPVGFFASGEVLTRDERFEVTLPADFRIVASGKQQQRRAADGKVLYRFRTSGLELPSFVVAGRYQEQVIQTPNGNVVFWTFRPLDPAVARMAAERLAATAALFANLFGPFPKPGPLRVVEAPAGLLSLDIAAPGHSAVVASFPQGLLLGPRVFEGGVASEPALQLAEAELARIWFGWRVPLRTDTDTLLGRGLGMFAVAMAAEARGGQEARRTEIARLLVEYDRARMAAGDEGSLMRPPEQCTPQQLIANELKGALFLAALDDIAGESRFEGAIQRLQATMAGRGLTLSIDDLRSSLENSTGMPMADVFRQWLARPGVPDDFRARYSAPSPLAPVSRPAAAARRAGDRQFRNVLISSRRQN